MNPKYCCEVEPENTPELVAVVRCKNCFYAKVAPDDNGYLYCWHPFASKGWHESNYYCASGELREGDKE